MNYDTQLLLLLAIGAIGMAGWIVAIWQYMRAEDAVSETSVAELERNLIRAQHADLVHVLAFPPYGHQPRDAQGRFAKDQPNRQRSGAEVRADQAWQASPNSLAGYSQR